MLVKINKQIKVNALQGILKRPRISQHHIQIPEYNSKLLDSQKSKTQRNKKIYPVLKGKDHQQMPNPGLFRCWNYNDFKGTVITMLHEVKMSALEIHGNIDVLTRK